MQEDQWVNTESLIETVAGEQSEQEQEPEMKVDKAYIGMTISELKEVYKSSEFIEEPVHEYGVDGESNGLVVEQDNERLFFVWTLQGEEIIHGMTILSDAIMIDNNVRVGMTLASFMDKYPDATVHIDMVDGRYEYLDVPGLSYRPEFLTTGSSRVADYDFGQPEPRYRNVKRPDAKIERISVN